MSTRNIVGNVGNFIASINILVNTCPDYTSFSPMINEYYKIPIQFNKQKVKSNCLQILGLVMNLGKILFSPMPAGTIKNHLMSLCGNY